MLGLTLLLGVWYLGTRTPAVPRTGLGSARTMDGVAHGASDARNLGRPTVSDAAIGRKGTLTLDQLREAVATGDIETVIVGFTDHYGRLMGKRYDAELFVEETAVHGTHGCDYLLTTDMEMEPVPGLPLRQLGAGLRRLSPRAGPDTLSWRAGWRRPRWCCATWKTSRSAGARACRAALDAAASGRRGARRLASRRSRRPSSNTTSFRQATAQAAEGEYRGLSRRAGIWRTITSSRARGPRPSRPRCGAI